MSCAEGVSIVTDGLVEVIDPAYATGTGTYNLTNKLSKSTIVSNNFTVGSTLPVTTLLSNTDATGAGSSYATVTRNTALESGSITFSIWFNLNNVPLHTGVNNDYRVLLTTAASAGTSGYPLSMIVEYAGILNFNTVQTDLPTTVRRFLNGSFAPVTLTLDGWQNIVYTYASATGVAACYKNNTLIRTGPMTTDTIGSNATTAGTSLVYTNYTSTGFRFYAGSNLNTANPNGNGPVPGQMGIIHIYNTALSAADVSQNFNAIRGRYGI